MGTTAYYATISVIDITYTLKFHAGVLAGNPSIYSFVTGISEKPIDAGVDN